MRRLLLVALLALACKREAEQTGGLPGVGKPRVEDAGRPMTVTTPAWLPGQKIPREYTCDGDDKNPEVKWGALPRDTKSVLVIVDDPDAPHGTFTHWVVFDMPAISTHIPEGEAEGIGTVAKNDFGKTKWSGPCPPKGAGEHRYFFRVYALDLEKLGLDDGCSRADVERKIDGHVLARAETMGRYGR